MCLRFAIRRLELLLESMKAEPLLPGFFEHILPSFNIPPAMLIPIVYPQNQKRILDVARWGFVPNWATGGSSMPKPGNAKSETVATSGMFRHAFKAGRCLIPADGFYDWVKDSKPKQPFFFHRRNDGPFGFAGIYSESAGEKTCAIITTAPNDLVRPVHHRMPVVLKEEFYDRWLDPKTPPKEVHEIMGQPYPDDFVRTKVSTFVNRTQNQGPKCVEPVTESVEIVEKDLFS